MAKTKKGPSPVMNELEQRIAGMKSIDKSLDLGNGVTVDAGNTVIIAAQTALNEYNETLALADDKLNDFGDAEKAARAFNKKILPAVGLKYGTDSSEYEMVGGKRDSERKRPKRKTKTT